MSLHLNEELLFIKGHHIENEVQTTEYKEKRAIHTSYNDSLRVFKVLQINKNKADNLKEK